jgi:phosphatidate cytidylyltransferase
VSNLSDPVFQQLLGGIFAALALGTILGQTLKRRARTESARATVANMNQRIMAWWFMCAVFGVAVLTGGIGSIILFALLSFLALREFITLVDSGRADHRALLIAFFIALPAQYVLVGIGWYGLFSILIPVYAFLLIPGVLAIIGETENFLQRTATIQWGLAVCVYAISHAPALLFLDIPATTAARRCCCSSSFSSCRSPMSCSTSSASSSGATGSRRVSARTRRGRASPAAWPGPRRSGPRCGGRRPLLRSKPRRCRC